MDKITLERVELLHPKLRAEAKEILQAISEALTGRAIVRFTSTLRTFAEQTALYAKGRTTAGTKVTNAKAGTSYHNYGLAIDIVLIIDGKEASWENNKDWDADGKADWREIVTIFKEYGWEWGGDWKFQDTPHFQKTFGYNVRQLLELYNNKKLIQNTNYVNI